MTLGENPQPKPRESQQTPPLLAQLGPLKQGLNAQHDAIEYNFDVGQQERIDMQKLDPKYVYQVTGSADKVEFNKDKIQPPEFYKDYVVDPAVDLMALYAQNKKALTPQSVALIEAHLKALEKISLIQPQSDKDFKVMFDPFTIKDTVYGETGVLNLLLAFTRAKKAFDTKTFQKVLDPKEQLVLKVNLEINKTRAVKVELYKPPIAEFPVEYKSAYPGTAFFGGLDSVILSPTADIRLLTNGKYELVFYAAQTKTPVNYKDFKALSSAEKVKDPMYGRQSKENAPNKLAPLITITVDPSGKTPVVIERSCITGAGHSVIYDKLFPPSQQGYNDPFEKYLETPYIEQVDFDLFKKVTAGGQAYGGIQTGFETASKIP